MRKHGSERAAAGDETESTQCSESRPAIDWWRRPIAALIDHILFEHHVPTWRGLARLTPQARRACREGGRCAEIGALALSMCRELPSHLLTEERVLFPRIHAFVHATHADERMRLLESIRTMAHTHDEIERELERIRTLSEDYRADGGSPSLRALCEELRPLDANLRVHLHLEENILLPRVLALHPAGA